MTDLVLRSLQPDDMLDLMGLQVRYAARYPGAQVIPPEIYAGPAYEGGRNILCVRDAQGELIAYAVLYPQLNTGANDTPHPFWFAIEVDPSAEVDRVVLEDRLFVALGERARDILAREKAEGLALLSAELSGGDQPMAALVERHGFDKVFGTYRLIRDLTQPVPDRTTVDGVTISTWPMADESEQNAYLAAKNVCFPEAPWTLDELQHMLSCVVWKSGGAVAAWAGDDLVGSVLTYRIPEDTETPDAGLAYTEEVFVLPDYRGRGVARAMVAYGLASLRDCGATRATLEVRADNGPALALYEGLGYERVSSNMIWSRALGSADRRQTR